MKLIAYIFYMCCVLSAAILAQSSVTLTIKPQLQGITIPEDFSGLSLETGSLRSGNAGTTGNMFDDSTTFPSNLHLQVITLFKELGLKHIRVGGGSVDANNTTPTNYDIDAFFRFAKAIDANVVYSVRLLNGNITDDTNIVKYVWNNYKQYIDCFSIGNEPDWSSYHNQDPVITNYPTYLTDWRKFATAILTAVPEAKFGGPDTGSNYPIPGAANTNYNGVPWTNLFANDQKNSGIVKSIFLHNYVGQGAPSIGSGVSIKTMIDLILCTAWVNSYYPALYNASCLPVAQIGYPFRLTESNSFSGYRADGSNSFATALFALDYMHWWAAHGAAGINFHNKQWVGNGPVYMDANKNFQVYPVGYGIKAFDLGGHGIADSVSIADSSALNLTAYAVHDTNSLYVTIINKEHNTGARDASVMINANIAHDSAKVIYLTALNGVSDTVNVLLGGAAITNIGWHGTWSSLDSTKNGNYVVTVPAGSAAIVKINGSFVTSVLGKTYLPIEFTLHQNYPNPFNPSTMISYDLPESDNVMLKIYNLMGQEIKILVDGFQSVGNHKIVWNGDNNYGIKAASGIYFYRLKVNNYYAIKKMILLK